MTSFLLLWKGHWCWIHTCSPEHVVSDISKSTARIKRHSILELHWRWLWYNIPCLPLLGDMQGLLHSLKFYIKQQASLFSSLNYINLADLCHPSLLPPTSFQITQYAPLRVFKAPTTSGHSVVSHVHHNGTFKYPLWSLNCDGKIGAWWQLQNLKGN